MVAWKPIERTLRGHVRSAVEIIEGWLGSAKVGDVLPFKQLCRGLGIMSHALKYDVRSHSEFIEAVSELGVVEWGRGVRFTGFTIVA